MKLISVIVPVYNSGDNLRSTIESVLSQITDAVELILVDDGSKDNSLKICNEYASADSRVKVISKSNGGLCEARNVGIDAAEGKYVAFLDHDDWYVDHFFTVLLEIVSEEESDVIKYGYRYVYCRKDKIVKRVAYKAKLKGVTFSKDEFGAHYAKLMDNVLLAFIWDAVYKRDFLVKYNIKFDTRYKFGREDIAFNSLVYIHASSFRYVPICLYEHAIRSNSTYHSVKKDGFEKYFCDVIANFGLEDELLKLYKVDRYDAGYSDYRKLKQVMDAVGFLMDHANGLDSSAIQYYVDKFHDLYSIERINMIRADKYLKVRQKVVLKLFLYKRTFLLSLLIKIYSEYKRMWYFM